MTAIINRAAVAATLCGLIGSISHAADATKKDLEHALAASKKTGRPVFAMLGREA